MRLSALPGGDRPGCEASMSASQCAAGLTGVLQRRLFGKKWIVGSDTGEQPPIFQQFVKESPCPLPGPCIAATVSRDASTHSSCAARVTSCFPPVRLVDGRVLKWKRPLSRAHSTSRAGDVWPGEDCGWRRGPHRAVLFAVLTSDYWRSSLVDMLSCSTGCVSNFAVDCSRSLSVSSMPNNSAASRRSSISVESCNRCWSIRAARLSYQQ